MPETVRPAWSRGLTFLRFAARQRGRLGAIRAGLPPPDASAPLLIDGGEQEWKGVGFTARQGERFRLTARGFQWIARPLGLAIEPQNSLWMRIGRGPIRKVLEADAVYEAWDDGEVTVFSKGLSEWADRDGAVLPGPRTRQGPGLSVRASATDAPATPGNALDGWNPLWRIGEGRAFTVAGEMIEVTARAEVGILCKPLDLPLAETTTVSWDWKIDALPSTLAEDLPFTHDYLSLAVEFDNGRDLTWMWSAELPVGRTFRCPLSWWCDRETHTVARSGTAALGTWLSERRSVLAEYRDALGEPAPQRIVAVWLIANSVFQRGEARATFRNIVVG